MTSEEPKHFVLTKDTKLSSLIDESPMAIEYLLEYGLHCLHCIFNNYETLEMGAQNHGMSDVEIQEMIDEVNERLQEIYNTSE